MIFSAATTGRKYPARLGLAGMAEQNDHNDIAPRNNDIDATGLVAPAAIADATMQPKLGPIRWIRASGACR